MHTTVRPPPATPQGSSTTTSIINLLPTETKGHPAAPTFRRPHIDTGTRLGPGQTDLWKEVERTLDNPVAGHHRPTVNIDRHADMQSTMTEQQKKTWRALRQLNALRPCKLNLPSLVVLAQESELCIKSLGAWMLTAQAESEPPLHKLPTPQTTASRYRVTKEQSELIDRIFEQHGHDSSMMPANYRRIVVNDPAYRELRFISAQTWGARRTTYARQALTGHEGVRHRFAPSVRAPEPVILPPPQEGASRSMRGDIVDRPGSPNVEWPSKAPRTIDGPHCDVANLSGLECAELEDFEWPSDLPSLHLIDLDELEQYV